MLVLLLLVLIVALFVLVVLFVLILVFVLIVLIVLILIFVLVVVLHNVHSFLYFGLHTHYATHHADLCVPRLLDCHARWSSNAYRKDANVMVEAITIGTLIHQSHGAST